MRTKIEERILKDLRIRNSSKLGHSEELTEGHIRDWGKYYITTIGKIDTNKPRKTPQLVENAVYNKRGKELFSTLYIDDPEDWSPSSWKRNVKPLDYDNFRFRSTYAGGSVEFSHFRVAKAAIEEIRAWPMGTEFYPTNQEHRSMLVVEPTCAYIHFYRGTPYELFKYHSANLGEGTAALYNTVIKINLGDEEKPIELNGQMEGNGVPFGIIYKEDGTILFDSTEILSQYGKENRDLIPNEMVYAINQQLQAAVDKYIEELRDKGVSRIRKPGQAK